MKIKMNLNKIIHNLTPLRTLVNFFSIFSMTTFREYKYKTLISKIFIDLAIWSLSA